MMCGRVRLPLDWSEIKIALKFDDRFAAPNMARSWNTAPTDPVLTAVRDPETGTRRPLIMKWGLIPWWAKEPKLKFSTFNAKAETVATASAFRDAWKRGQRCLVVTDGFYEWRKEDKQPFAIGCVAGSLTVLAGLWDRWKSLEGERINSCTVITTEPNELLAPIHNRMPVILAPEDWPKWLGEAEANETELKGLLKPFPPERMRLWPIGKRVGSVKNNDAELVEPITLAA